MGCGKNLVDRAIAAAGDDAINFSSASFSNGFAGQSCSVAGFPSDPHFHNLTVLAQCANGRSQSSIAGCLAVQNNADGCHTLRPWCSREHQVRLGLEFAARCAAIFDHTPSQPQQPSCHQTDGRLVVKLEWALEANLPSDWTYPSRTRVSGWQCLATAWLTATADGPTPSWCSVRWLQVHPNRHSPSPFSTAAKIWQAGSLRQARYGRETGFQLNRQPIAMMGY